MHKQCKSGGKKPFVKLTAKAPVSTKRSSALCSPEPAKQANSKRNWIYSPEAQRAGNSGIYRSSKGDFKDEEDHDMRGRDSDEGEERFLFSEEVNASGDKDEDEAPPEDNSSSAKKGRVSAS
ncbi:hypothetical protein B484DRAFT_409493 [Ochromonadaceae sp. CCMP2298]|nr:hypothetical protein B484DRAFT_409493 [Ochromonadaceae sp. CCMP2298]